MRFAVQILYFDCEQFILQAIENCAPFVDKIYISYSKLPWIYNSEARGKYENSVDRDLIFTSAYANKIELLEGEWETEEGQRNFCLQKAKEDGFDFLIIQDADEFYTEASYLQNLREIEENPDALYYRNPWHLFWKDTNHVIEFDEVHGKRNTIINFNACFAVNCHKDVWFKKNRLMTTTDAFFLSGICCHLSYIMSDEQMNRKINTWGHSHQVMDKELWFRVKWLGWQPEVRDIGLINPVSWRRAVPFEGELPPQCRKIEIGYNKYIFPSYPDRFKYSWIVLKARILKLLRNIRSK